jgi:endonuclease YncB( thermonuclease family)
MGLAMRLTLGFSLTGMLVMLALLPVSAAAQSYAGPAYVMRAVDGVTLYADVNGQIETVRYLGVRVPLIEDPVYGSRPYAVAAREANRRLVEARWIYLVFDGQPRAAQGRLRAWVWRDGLFVNGSLVNSGWLVPTVTDLSLVEYFGNLETGARQDARGLWRSPRSIAYYRQQPRGDTIDAGGPDSGDTRVFSAPAPFAPPAPSSPGRTSSAPGRTSSAPSLTPTPSVSSPSSSGGMGYTPPSSSRSTGGRTVR